MLFFASDFFIYFLYRWFALHQCCNADTISNPSFEKLFFLANPAPLALFNGQVCSFVAIPLFSLSKWNVSQKRHEEKQCFVVSGLNATNRFVGLSKLEMTFFFSTVGTVTWSQSFHQTQTGLSNRIDEILEKKVEYFCITQRVDRLSLKLESCIYQIMVV